MPTRRMAKVKFLAPPISVGLGGSFSTAAEAGDGTALVILGPRPAGCEDVPIGGEAAKPPEELVATHAIHFHSTQAIELFQASLDAAKQILKEAGL